MTRSNHWLALWHWAVEEPGEAASEIQSLRGLVWDLREALQSAKSFGSQGDTHEGLSVSNIIDVAIAKADKELEGLNLDAEPKGPTP